MTDRAQDDTRLGTTPDVRERRLHTLALLSDLTEQHGRAPTWREFGLERSGDIDKMAELADSDGKKVVLTDEGRALLGRMRDERAAGERFTLYAESEHVDYWTLHCPDHAAEAAVHGFQDDGGFDGSPKPGDTFEVVASEWRVVKASEIVSRAGARPDINALQSAGEDFMCEGADYWPPEEHYTGVLRAILRGDVDAYCDEHGCQPGYAEHMRDLPPVLYRWLGEDRFEPVGEDEAGGDGNE